MKLYYLVFTVFLASSCFPSKNLVTYQPDIESEQLDTLVVRAFKKNIKKLPVEHQSYRASSTRKNDLLHTELHISFDMVNRSVIGEAYLTLKPWFSPVNEIILDAKRFTLKEVSIIKGDKNKNLDYTYDRDKLIIHLDRQYTREENYTLYIDYVAHPDDGSTKSPYSIGSDQGLFFIDPDESNPNKPTQIWTQGETESNSRWFPTIDKPNERCTQELYVTVDNKYKTLSNGLLLSSVDNKNGMRTDHWKLDLAHAPYLFALVVGDYAIQSEKWRGIDLDYYVEKDYESSAKEIFNHTPEMLDFFSKITGVPYPWPKFSQVIVRDFVSGAMENTTAVVFAESFQKTKAELVDFPNDHIVAHELFHHWFGNLVTCESWANLTLNEGFANYAEYLWTEYKYGKDEADYHKLHELYGYIVGAHKIHPLIYYEYEDKDAMFDSHSYNKGGLVLHMLRNYLGDEVFFAGFNKYLLDNAFSDVEAHELRLAFEEVSGEDLNWFFDQWYFDKGHPQLNIDYQYSDSVRTLSIHVEQVQDETKHRAIFKLPLSIEIFFPDGKSQIKQIWIEKRNQDFNFIFNQAPALIIVDGDKTLLFELSQDKTQEQNVFQFLNAKHFLDRNSALNLLRGDSKYKYLFEKALWDSFWKVRLTGLRQIEAPFSVKILNRMKYLLDNDQNPLVRLIAMQKLESSETGLDPDFIITILQNEKSASVISAALDLLQKKDNSIAYDQALNLINDHSYAISNSVGYVLANSGKYDHLEFFEARMFKGNVFRNTTLLSNYSYLLNQQSPETITNKSIWLINKLEEMTYSTFRKQLFLNIVHDQISNLKSLSQSLSGSEKKQVENCISEIQENLK